MQRRRRQQLVVVGAAVLVGLTFGTASAAGGGGQPEAAATTAPAVVRTMAAVHAVDAALPEPDVVPLETTTTTAAVESTTSTAEAQTTTTEAPETTTTTAAPTTTTTAPPPPPPPPPEPEPEPAAAPSGGSVEDAIRRWFPEVYEQASDIAWCESRHDPGAVSAGGGNHGLFQINNVHRASFERVTGVAWADGIYDADRNSQFARWLYDQEGWSPWACA